MLSTLPAAAAANAPRLKQAEIARTLLHDLQEGKAVVEAARNTVYAPALAEFEITPQQIAALAAQVEQGLQLSADVVAGRRGEKAATATDDAEKTSLVATIERVQTGAHLKWDATADPDLKRRNLERYFIGSHLENLADARLENVAQTILTNLQSESLPSVKAPQIAALTDALNEWLSADEGADPNPTAQGNYANLLALAKTIKNGRRQLQIAADAAFPYRLPSSVDARKAFHLPLRQRFV